MMRALMILQKMYKLLNLEITSYVHILILNTNNLPRNTAHRVLTVTGIYPEVTRILYYNEHLWFTGTTTKIQLINSAPLLNMPEDSIIQLVNFVPLNNYVQS